MLQDLPRVDRMTLHLRSLFRCHRSRFVENRGRNTKLSDIVQQCSSIQERHLPLLEAQLERRGARVFRDIGRVLIRSEERRVGKEWRAEREAAQHKVELR